MAIETLEPLLREHPFLISLTDAQVAFMTGCAKNVRFAAGEFLFREGNDPGHLFLVRTGQVALEIHVPGKGAVTLETLGEGDVVGWSWLFPPFESTLDARAVEAVRAFALDRTCLKNKMEVDHDFGYALAKQLLLENYMRLHHVRMQRADLYKAEP